MTDELELDLPAAPEKGALARHVLKTFTLLENKISLLYALLIHLIALVLLLVFVNPDDGIGETDSFAGQHVTYIEFEPTPAPKPAAALAFPAPVAPTPAAQPVPHAAAAPLLAYQAPASNSATGGQARSSTNSQGTAEGSASLTATRGNICLKVCGINYSRGEVDGGTLTCLHNAGSQTSDTGYCHRSAETSSGGVTCMTIYPSSDPSIGGMMLVRCM